MQNKTCLRYQLGSPILPSAEDFAYYKQLAIAQSEGFKILSFNSLKLQEDVKNAINVSSVTFLSLGLPTAGEDLTTETDLASLDTDRKEIVQKTDLPKQRIISYKQFAKAIYPEDEQEQEKLVEFLKEHTTGEVQTISFYYLPDQSFNVELFYRNFVNDIYYSIYGNNEEQLTAIKKSKNQIYAKLNYFTALPVAAVSSLMHSHRLVLLSEKEKNAISKDAPEFFAQSAKQYRGLSELLSSQLVSNHAEWSGDTPEESLRAFSDYHGYYSEFNIEKVKRYETHRSFYNNDGSFVSVCVLGVYLAVLSTRENPIGAYDRYRKINLALTGKNGDETVNETPW